MITNTCVAVYRWGSPRPVWERRGDFAMSVGGLTLKRFVSVLYSRQLWLFARLAHEPDYKMDIPASLQPTGLLLLQESPITLAVWTRTGKLTRVFLPDQRLETVTVGDTPLTHAVRYRDNEIILADEQGKVTLLRGKEIVHQWNDSPAGVYALTVHRREPWVLTAGVDGILRVYDLRQRQLRWAVTGHRWDILAAEFIDDEQILSVGADRQALVWRAPSQLPHIRLRVPPLQQPVMLQRDAQQKLWLATTDAMHQLLLDSASWRTTKLIIPSLNKEE